MTIYLETRRWGSITNPHLKDLREELRQFDDIDEEHPDAWLSNDEGWTLIANQDGTMTLETPNDPNYKYLYNVPRDKMLSLWVLLEPTSLTDFLQEDWQAQ